MIYVSYTVVALSALLGLCVVYGGIARLFGLAAPYMGRLIDRIWNTTQECNMLGITTWTPHETLV